MRLRSTSVVLTCLALSSTFCAPRTADGAPKRAYHLVLDRPAREGYRAEYTGLYRYLSNANGKAFGENAGDIENTIDAKYDVIDKVTKVDSHGRPLEQRLFFKSLKLRVENTENYEEAECVRTPLTVVRWPEVSITRDDGQDMNPDELALLKHLYGRHDPDGPSEDDLLGPGHDVTVGETWQPSSQAITQILHKEGLLVPDNGVTIQLTLSSVKKVGSIDCLLIDVRYICPNIDGDTTEPDTVKSVHGRFEKTYKWEVPIDTSLPKLYSEAITKVNYNGVVNGDGIPVNVVLDRTIVEADTFVKEL